MDASNMHHKRLTSIKVIVSCPLNRAIFYFLCGFVSFALSRRKRAQPCRKKTIMQRNDIDFATSDPTNEY